ncbi:hypothetical protein [Bryobacter aggregatus]|uniref:hypothetical protein n=1 Tax=Bryobacter aggregatus TaxID=360054 RepID=UPI0004E1B367|nr:hypothetical protein [Bryobacter aggregatus]
MPIPERMRLQTQLEQLKQLLQETPGSFSLATAGAALEAVSQGWIQLREDLLREEARCPESEEEILPLLVLWERVYALYRQAANFYGGLAGESIQHGSWEAAAYGMEGDWASAGPRPGSRLQVEG